MEWPCGPSFTRSLVPTGNQVQKLPGVCLVLFGLCVKGGRRMTAQSWSGLFHCDKHVQRREDDSTKLVRPFWPKHALLRLPCCLRVAMEINLVALPCVPNLLLGSIRESGARALQKRLCTLALATPQMRTWKFRCP